MVTAMFPMEIGSFLNSEALLSNMVFKKNKHPWNKGIPRTEEEKRKMSENHKGKKFSEKHRKNLSENHADFKGEKHPRFGKGISNQIRADIEIDIKYKNLTEKEIIKKYGICRSTVQRIKRKMIKIYEN
jgi:hypothetical protein